MATQINKDLNMMRQMVAQKDWSKTPLGPMQGWSPALKAHAQHCLDSRFPSVIWWGSDLTQIYNDGYRDICGGKHPKALGQSARDCWSEMWDIIYPMIKGVLDTDIACWIEESVFCPVRHGFAEECYFTFSFSPIHDERGKPAGIFETVANMTNQVLAQRRLALLRDLGEQAGLKSLEAACYGAADRIRNYQYDLPFSLIYLTESTENEAILLGISGIEKDHPAAIARVQLGAGKKDPWRFNEAQASDQMVVFEEIPVEFGRLPGGPWPEAVKTAVVLPIREPASRRIFGFFVTGISPRRSLDKAYVDFLNLIVSHLSRSFSTAEAYEVEKKRAEALAELDRAKTVFFSNISHEFRTPLTLILGPLESMLSIHGGHGETLGDADRKQLEVAFRNVLRLLKLVNTLLDFSRVEAGRAQVNYERTDIGAITTDIATGFRHSLESADLIFDIQCASVVAHVDPDMWEKIVMNLLSNAFKFTKKGKISVQLTETEGKACLRVSDTGCGIAPKDLPRVFERFYRGSSEKSRTHEGTGIGLSFSKDLIKLHGGSIEVESTPGEGSVFTVLIPLGTAHVPKTLPQDFEDIGELIKSDKLERVRKSYLSETLSWIQDQNKSLTSDSNESSQSDPNGSFKPDPKGSIAPDPSGSRSDRKKILLADDNADMREYIRGILAPFFELILCKDGEEAYDTIQKELPSLVISDVMMPKLDGTGLLKKLRANPATEFIPVVFLSARAGEEAMIEGLELGADDYLMKPFSRRELIARAKANINLARLRNLEVVNRNLENLQADLNQFVHIAAHDMTEPLRRISMLIDLFIDTYREKLEINQLEEIEVIQNYAIALDELIQEFRHLARIDSGEVSREELKLQPLIESVLAENSQLIKEKKAKISFKGLSSVRANRTLIIQLYRNLIMNAIKHGTQDMMLEFSQVEEGGRAVLEICNSGPTIEPEQVAQLFVPFNRFSKAEGLGLGLYICRKIAEAHKGTILCKSEDGLTRFQIKLESKP